MTEPFKKAVLIPCFNEELTIGKVIDDFRRELPDADIYVFNNNSTDRTTAIAEEKQAIVINEKKTGQRLCHGLNVPESGGRYLYSHRW